MEQLAFFESAPQGFRYQTEFITPEEETELISRIESLPYKPYEHGEYTGKRMVRWMNEGSIPSYLNEIRDRAAAYLAIDSARIHNALVTKYEIGAPIGWHRDRPPYKEVIGISLASPCRFRLRRSLGAKWERYTKVAEPRSLYLMSGEARYVWQHSIPPVEALRYSITFRSV